ncbi:MAG: hypothetical protein ABFC78_06435 [Methanoregula sp.]
MFIGKNTTHESFSEILKKQGITVESVHPHPITPNGVFGKYVDPKGDRTKFFYEVHEQSWDYDAYVSYIFYDLQPTDEQILTAIKDTEKFSTCMI